MTDIERLQLARDVYNYVLDFSEDFAEDFIGEDLAYLLGAILCDGNCVWIKDRPIITLLNEYKCNKYSNMSAVWQFIKFEDA